MAPIVDRFGSSRGGRDGAIAQLGERVVRNDEVGGSIPPGSTTLRPSGYAWCPAKPLGEAGLSKKPPNPIPLKTPPLLLRRLHHPGDRLARQPSIQEMRQPGPLARIVHGA